MKLGQTAYTAFMTSARLEARWDEESPGQKHHWIEIEAACAALNAERIRNALLAYLEELKTGSIRFEAPILRQITIRSDLISKYADEFTKRVEADLVEKGESLVRPLYKVCARVGEQLPDRFVATMADADGTSPGDLAYAHEQLAPEFDPRSTALLGLHPGEIEAARAKARGTGTTTITVNLGENPVSGVYEITSKQLELLRLGGTAELRYLRPAPTMIDMRDDR